MLGGQLNDGPDLETYLLMRWEGPDALTVFIPTAIYLLDCAPVFSFSDTEALYVDLNLSITNGMVSSKIYDKQDDFNFEIVNFPLS